MKSENISQPANTEKSPRIGIVFIVIGTGIFSLQDVIIKWMSGDYPVHEIALISNLIAIIPIFLTAHFTGGIRLLRTRHLGAHIFRSFLLFNAYLFFYLSLAALPLAEAVTLFFSTPLFITVLSVAVLKENVTPDRWIALFAGFLGVIVMLKPTQKIMNPAAFLAILSAVFYAITSILTKRMGKTESGVALTFYTIIIYIICSAILGIILNNRAPVNASHASLSFLLNTWALPTQTDFYFLVMLGLITSIGFFCLSQAYRLAQPSSVAPFEYSGVLFSVLLGYIFWKDIPDVHAITGIILIVGSGIYIFDR